MNIRATAGKERELYFNEDLDRMDFVQWCRENATETRNFTLSIITDLQEHDLVWRPRHDANPIAWILWHIGEYEERILWEYYQQEPIYRFKKSCLDSDFQDLPTGEALTEYLGSTRKAFFAFIDSLTSEQLEEAVKTERFSKISLRDLLTLPIHHEKHHAGQIAYIRRLMGKPLPASNANIPHS